MKLIFMLYLLAALLISWDGYGQVGEKVTNVEILNMQNDTVMLPFLGQKNLLIFYADPAKPRQNKDFRNYFKTHPLDTRYVDSYGVINLAAAPLIPNGLIRRKALKEVKGVEDHLYLDPNNVLSTAWRLPGATDNFAVIFVNKDRIIEFYKAGQLTDAEQQQVISLVKKYEHE